MTWNERTPFRERANAATYGVLLALETDYAIVCVTLRFMPDFLAGWLHVDTLRQEYAGAIGLGCWLAVLLLVYSMIPAPPEQRELR